MAARILPTIVCLCGSTELYELFEFVAHKETMAGKIVLSIGYCPRAQGRLRGQEQVVSPSKQAELADLHLRKIDMADEILVLNKDGRLDNQTAAQVRYAASKGKRVRWLDDEEHPPTALHTEGSHKIWKARIATRIEIEALADDPKQAYDLVQSNYPGSEIESITDFWTGQRQSVD